MKSISKMFKALLGGVVLLLVLTLAGQAAAQGWTELFPTGGPPAGRLEASAEYDPGTNRMILFAGEDNVGNCGTSCLFNDVWVLEHANGLGGTPTWTQLAPTGTLPSVRTSSKGFYDQNSNRMTVFGGRNSVGSCGAAIADLWVLENANGVGTPNWIQLTPVGGPGARSSHSVSYDSANNRMIMFAGGGACGPFFNDVWVLEHANGLGGTPTWTQLAPTGSLPPTPTNYGVVYDQPNNRLIVFTETNPHQLWILEHANGLGGTPTWSQVAFTGTNSVFGARFSYDPATNEMFQFGGFNLTGTRVNDVYVLDNANGLAGTPDWQQLSPAPDPVNGLPTPRSNHTQVYDAASRRMTIFGGTQFNLGNGDDFNDVWVLTDANGIVTVPFDGFDAKVEIELGPLANDDEFEVKATFTLGAGSNGIDPLTEDVSFQVGTFSATIPAGSFHFKPAKPGKHGKPGKPAYFTFEGIIDGVALEAKITPLGGNGFEFKAEGDGADLTGTTNPVSLGLTIGDDGGSVMVTAEFE